MATETLFAATEEATSGKKFETPDFYNWWAREKHGAPEGWHWVELDSRPEKVGEGYFKVEGAVCPLRPKGGVNWKERQRGTELSFTVSRDQFKAFQREKGAAAGVCFNCWGHGKELCGWSKAGGDRYRECSECKGTGKPAGVTA